MALKFRRGTTAQQSGSLAFGEPYVNTTLGTLVVGGQSGDIVLSTSGTGSTGNFGAISGSGLDITGNANIAGNLTLGGNITIGDATTDTVQVTANLSSSLIPSANNAFDLGSATKIWKDLYISSGSIKMYDGSGVLVSTITATTLNANTSSINQFNTFTGSQLTQNSALATITGSLISSASTAKTTNDSQDVSITNLNTTTASLNTSVSNLNTTSASVNTSVSSLNTYTSSLKSAVSISGTDLTVLGNLTVQGDTTTLNTANLLVEDKLIELAIGTTTSAGADGAGLFISGANASILWDDAGSQLDINKSVDVAGNITLTGTVDGVDVSVLNSNINSFSSSQLTQNSALATITGSLILSASSDVQRLGQLELTSASVNTSVSNLNTTSASLNTSVSNINVATSSLQSWSSSAKIELSNLELTSASVNTSVSNLNTTSASVNTSVTNLNSFTSSINTTIKTKLDAETVISASSQVRTLLSAGSGISYTSATGVIAASQIGTANLAANANIANSQLANSSITIAGTSTALGGTITLATITGGSSIVSGSSISSPAQGQVTLTTNGVAASAVNLGLQTSSSPTFAGLTINGAITATGDITAYYSSDKRYKNNIQVIGNALEKVKKLNGVTWEWNDDVNDVTKAAPTTGLIAQEVQEVLPQVVKEKEDGFLGLDYAKMIGLLVEAIKEQQQHIDNLTIQVEELKKQKGL